MIAAIVAKNSAWYSASVGRTTFRPRLRNHQPPAGSATLVNHHQFAMSNECVIGSGTASDSSVPASTNRPPPQKNTTNPSIPPGAFRSPNRSYNASAARPQSAAVTIPTSANNTPGSARVTSSSMPSTNVSG